MAVCPSCRRQCSAVGRVCPHCGSELPGRTRLGSTPPTDENLGATLVGPPPLESTSDSPDSPEDSTAHRSESPQARRFEGGGSSTWFGHRDSRSGAESPVEDEVPPDAGDAPREGQGPPPIVTHHSPKPLVGEGTWIRVRGPARPRAIAVRTRKQKRPWQNTRYLGIAALWWAITGGILLAGLGGALVARLVPRPALKVIAFEVTADGRDLLTVSCGGCADGSTLRLGPASATLLGGVAQLSSTGLQVGENRLPLDLESPDGQAVRIEVTVALAFRVSTDLRGITEVPPFALVVVSAPRGTSVTIGGSPVPSEPGVMRAKIDLSPETTGPAARPVDIQRKIPVRVLGPDLERSTHATIAASIVPLVLDPATPSRQGAELIVTGRTGARAEVRLLQGGSAVAATSADPDGRFVLRATGLPAGRAAVAASTPGRVSRQVALRIP